jgi:hypothetical protein
MKRILEIILRRLCAGSKPAGSRHLDCSLAWCLSGGRACAAEFLTVPGRVGSRPTMFDSHRPDWR